MAAMTLSGAIHIAAAVMSVLFGVRVFLSKKGTLDHRHLGWMYLFAMAFVNGAALLTFEDSKDGFGIFHYLALLSLATISIAAVAGRKIRTNRSYVWPHAYIMSWSYAGLLAAAVGQAAAALELGVGLSVTMSLLIAGVIIHTLVRSAVQKAN